VQPVAEVGQIAREQGARFLVDAAQSLGHVPLSVREMQIDLLAAPGHKGLLGPLGTGFLYIRPGVETELQSIRQGGTGSHSDEDRQPDDLPDKYEPGNLNAMGIYGLRAGLDYVCGRGVEQIRTHAQRLTLRLLDALAEIRGVRIYGPSDADRQVGVVSITVEGCSPTEVAAILDARFGVQVRAGVHCAPRMHEVLGTLAQGGTVRFSLGPFNTEDHIDSAVAAVSDIAAAEVHPAAAVGAR
jgi:selenocysteine lyase/cysteine desulfurase